MNTFLNFLKTPAKVISNLKVDEKGLINFSLPTEKFSTILLLATDNEDIVFDVIPLKSSKFEFRNLT